MIGFNENEGCHIYYVYIITNPYRSTYYIGMTNNLSLRLQQHKENIEIGKKRLRQNTTCITRYIMRSLVGCKMQLLGKKS